MANQWAKFWKAIAWVVKPKKKKPITEEQLKKIFMAHDKNGDGHLDKEELKEVFRKLGARVPWYRAGRAIHYADIDIDEAINEYEIDHLVSYAIKCGYTSAPKVD